MSSFLQCNFTYLVTVILIEATAQPNGRKKEHIVQVLGFAVHHGTAPCSAENDEATMRGWVDWRKVCFELQASGL